MRLFSILFYFCIFFNVYASSKDDVIACLGREELVLHKERSQSAILKLNQELEEEFVNLSKIIVYKETEKKICDAQSPSLELMYQVMLNKDEIFDTEVIYESGVLNKYQSALNDKLVAQFLKKIQIIFIHYLSNIQSNFVKVNCYKIHFPIIHQFLERYKQLNSYEQNDLNIWDPKEILTILNYIRNEETILNVCSK